MKYLKNTALSVAIAGGFLGLLWLGLMLVTSMLWAILWYIPSPYSQSMVAGFLAISMLILLVLIVRLIRYGRHDLRR